MLILPAIDLFGGKAVRLFQGDYARMTVYHNDPLTVAKDFERSGARWVHVVDLEGARIGKPAHLDTVQKIVENTGLDCEIGGGIRDLETAKVYLSACAKRVILGTAAVTDPAFLQSAVDAFGEQVAVGVDLKDGMVAIKGWTELSGETASSFFAKMERVGVRTVICTDISRDGAMKGTNLSLYRELSCEFSVRIIASGGVSSLADVTALREMDLYGAIVGKAYYTGALNLKEAIEVAR